MTITLTRLTGDGYFAEIGDTFGVALNPVSDKTPAPCQYVLLTHWTNDLWQAAQNIAQRDEAIVVVPVHLSEHLENLYKSESPVNVMPVLLDQEIELPWGRLIPVACGHEYFFPNDPAPYSANGYVLAAEGHFLYYTGPTGMSPVLRDVGKLFKPDLTLLPVGEKFLHGQELCQAIMWLGSDIVLPFLKTENESLQGEVYGLIDMFTPAICRFLEEGDAYMLAPVEATGRTAGPEARY